MSNCSTAAIAHCTTILSSENLLLFLHFLISHSLCLKMPPPPFTHAALLCSFRSQLSFCFSELSLAIWNRTECEMEYIPVPIFSSFTLACYISVFSLYFIFDCKLFRLMAYPRLCSVKHLVHLWHGIILLLMIMMLMVGIPTLSNISLYYGGVISFRLVVVSCKKDSCPDPLLQISNWAANSGPSPEGL